MLPTHSSLLLDSGRGAHGMLGVGRRSERRMTIMECTVKLIWDSETDRWHTETEDVPGLVLEAASFDALVERVRMAAPEMLELNCGYIGPIKLSFEAERIENLELVS